MKKRGIFKRIKSEYTKYKTKIRQSLTLRIAASGILSAAAGIIISAIFTEMFLYGYFNIFDLRSIIIVTVVTLFIFLKLLKKNLSYINEISLGVSQISQGDYSVKLREVYTDQLGILAQQINKMASELSAAREREQLEEQRKNDFITSIAHDLRTPLTSVIGYLGLISEQDDAPVEKETLVRYADVAYRKSLRLQVLINELFDFSRYNFGEIKPVQNRIDIAELLEQLDQEFYPQYSEKNLSSRIIITGRPVYIKGDGSMIARVFDNILSNAIRYGASGKYIDVELFNRGHEAAVRITNYGSTIPDNEIAHIFDKFYRTDTSRNSAYGGTGLGMAIAKNIVDAHGGVISAQSVDGKTTFEVVFKTVA